MEQETNIRTKQFHINPFMSKNNTNQILYNNKSRIRKFCQPFSSSVLQERKFQSNKDINKISTKLHLIKIKCMKNTLRLGSRNSKHTSQSHWVNNQALNQSLDLDTEDDLKTQTHKIHLLNSPYLDRPATVFFQYPKCCEIPEKNNERVYCIEKAQLFYKIYGSEYKCIVNSLEYNGFQKCQSGSNWNIVFDMGGTKTKILEHMNKYQKINHFPGCWNIGRKDWMYKHLNKQKRLFPQAYSFVPVTYIFPSDFERFEMIRQNSQKNQLWIMKPTNAACGRGIKMVTKQTKIKNKKDYQVSEYISNPHLINNFKYDLRIYVLVTCYDPLKIYMFNDGLARFATYQYNTKIKDIKKRFIHLTNFSVNKHSKKYVKNSQSNQDNNSSKWSLIALKKYYQEIGIDSNALFQDIKSVIIKTCISVESGMLDMHCKTQEKRNCPFEIYGFDILIDSNLKPWLMQVNVCPSLASSSPMDRKIKHTLLTDTLNLIGLQYYSRKTYVQDKKRLKDRLLYKDNERKHFSKNLRNLQQLNYDNCVQILSPEDWKILFEQQQQMARKGNFERIFPLKNNIESFKKYFEFNRYNNNMLWKFIKSQKNFLDKLYQNY